MRIAVLMLITLPRIAICLLLALWAFSYHWLAGFLSCFILVPAAASFWGDYLNARKRSQEVPPRPSMPYPTANQPGSESHG